jgi:hypothetical protein
MDRFGVLPALAAEFCRGAAQQEKFFSGEVLGVDLLTGYTVCRQVAGSEVRDFESAIASATRGPTSAEPECHRQPVTVRFRSRTVLKS